MSDNKICFFLLLLLLLLLIVDSFNYKILIFVFGVYFNVIRKSFLLLYILIWNFLFPAFTNYKFVFVLLFFFWLIKFKFEFLYYLNLKVKYSNICICAASFQDASIEIIWLFFVASRYISKSSMHLFYSFIYSFNLSNKISPTCLGEAILNEAPASS